MNTPRVLPMFALLAAATLGACTGDSLQPTASQSAYTPNTSTGSSTSTSTTTSTSYAQYRPLSDFLRMQGTFCLDGAEGCKLFVPPVSNYIAWYDQEHGMAISVDYANVFNKWAISQGYPSFGTQISGSVTERPTGDGRAYVFVQLRANNASMFMTQGLNLAEDRLMLGTRPKEMTGGTSTTTSAQAALGQVSFDIGFINSGMGRPLPDLMALILKPESGQQYINSTFRFEGDVNYTDQYGNVSPSHISISKTGEIVQQYPGSTVMTPPMGYVSTTVTPR